MATPHTPTARALQRGTFSPMRWLASGAVVIAIAATGLSVDAHERHGRGAGGGAPGLMMFGGSPEHVERAVDRMLAGLDATDAQRSQIRQIATAAAADLKAQREAGRGLRAQSLAILTAPAIDANAAESLRQQMLAQHDQASRRMLQAMVDVGNVLTPEQRAQLGERFKQRAERMQQRHRDGAPR